MSDVIQQAVESNDAIRLKSIVVGILVTGIVFFFAVALIYSFVFYKTQMAFLDGVYLFLVIYLIGATATLMYYRMIVVGDKKIQIEQMSLGVVSAVFAKCFAAFFGILGFTMVAVALNPSMITIFENTLGFAFCQFWGVGDLLRNMLTSDLFDTVGDKLSPQDRDKYLNYDFLLTTWGVEHKDKLEETIKLACTQDNVKTRDLQFDFAWNSKTISREQVEKLLEFIDMKYYIGHFTWVYIGALFSLLVSIVATIMA
jgi:hypothetical protein